MGQVWVSTLVIKACRLNKQAIGNTRQDMTGPVLDELLADGYVQVRWNANDSRHSECIDLNRQVWDLDNFLNTTEYDAPLFSRSHPGDKSCTLTVSGPGLPDVEVDSFGDTDTAIGTTHLTPVKTVPSPTVKPKVPKQDVTEQVPIKLKKKIIHVPKEVHKQIKDPFDKEELSPEQYEDWLKTLEQENVEEETPPTPTEQDVEDWQHDLERETSLKPKHWIRGLFTR